MTEIKIDEKDVGRDYLNQLKKIIKIRVNRRKIYSDIFLDESPEALLSIIDGKRQRLNKLLKVKNKSSSQIEKISDEAYDIVNYYLFIAAVLNKRQKKNE